MRSLFVALLILALVPSLIASRAHAGGHIGTAMTDFTQVTPADAILYATVQSTDASQPTNLLGLAADFAAQPGYNRALRQLTAMGGSNPTSLIPVQLVRGLGKIFNGEFGLALLPIDVGHAAAGTPTFGVHLLLDAGLQPGVTADSLRGSLAILGLGGQPQPSYRGLSIVAVDLSAVLGSVVGSMGAPSLKVYSAVAGNDAVLASDLPTLHRAIDTWYGASPSLAATADFQATIGGVPAARFLTLYAHLDVRSLAVLACALNTGSASSTIGTLIRCNRDTGQVVSAPAGTVSETLSLSAEPDGILFGASPQVTTGALNTGIPLSTTPNAAASLLPASTLVYTSLNDPATLVRTAIEMAGPAVNRATGRSGDPIQQLNQMTGLDLDQDVFSWTHGELATALLPVGSNAYGAQRSNPLTALSGVVTLKIDDQSFVETKLQKIFAALNRLAGSNGPAPFQFTDSPGPNGEPLHILTQTPNGIGYTFYQGNLVVASHLPVDVVALQQGSAGPSLAAAPLYSAARSYLNGGSLGNILFVNVTHLRQIVEHFAAANGADMHSYNSSVRPFLTAFKSLAEAVYAGHGGGGALFIGIGR